MHSAETSKPTAKAPKNNALNILLVEDNAINVQVISSMLSHPKINLTIASHGEEGVKAYSSGSYHMVLMDISMPEMNGYEATQAIRAAEKKHGMARTPIIALTAHTLKGDEERCIEAGMDDFASKPISMVGLKAKLDQWGDFKIRGVGLG